MPPFELPKLPKQPNVYKGIRFRQESVPMISTTHDDTEEES